MLSHFAYTSSSRPLKEDDLRPLLELPHEVQEQVDYRLHENFNAPGLRHLRLMEKRNQAGMTEREWIRLAISHELDTATIDQRIVMSDLHSDNLPALIDALRSVSPERAEDVQRRYQCAFLQSYEALIEGPAVFRNTSKIIDILKAHGRAFPVLDVPAFDDASIRALDEDGIEALLEGLEVKLGSPSEIELPAYNDLDYKPYLVGDLLVIEDYASAHHYVYQRNGDEMAWHVMENRYPEFGTANDDWIGEFLHDRKMAVWMQFYQENPKPALRYVQGALVEADFNVHDLFLMQGSILDGMVEDGECELEPFPESFEVLVRTWTLTQEPWNLEVRAIAPLFESLQVREGRLGFERYLDVDSTLLDTYVSAGSVSEHDVKTMESACIPVELDETHRAEILDYLQVRKSAWTANADEKQAERVSQLIDAACGVVERAPRIQSSCSRAKRLPR